MRSILCFEPPPSPARNLPTTKGTTATDAGTAATQREREGEVILRSWRGESDQEHASRSKADIRFHSPSRRLRLFFLQNRKSCDEGEREREREVEAKEANWRRQLQLQTTAKGPSPDPPRSPRSRGVKFLPIPDLSRRRVSPSPSVHIRPSGYCDTAGSEQEMAKKAKIRSKVCRAEGEAELGPLNKVSSTAMTVSQLSLVSPLFVCLNSRFQ